MKSNTDDLVAWLPSRGEAPLPSSTLVGSEPDRRQKLLIKPFSVIARRLQIRELLMLSSIADNGNVPDSGVIFGNSINWIGQLLKVALNLVANEAFLPTITQYGK